MFSDHLPHSGAQTMTHRLLRIKGIFIAIIALALSASLAFGAQPPAAASFGLENASSHAGKTVPVAGTDPVTAGDEETDEEPADEEEEETLEDEEAEDAGDNCLVDPTGLTEEELAAMKHGSIVCWAAHQETPEGYANHGAWVSEWARAGKDGDETEDAAEAASTKDKGQGKGKGHAKGQQGRP
jgi:hypothetical protein